MQKKTLDRTPGLGLLKRKILPSQLYSRAHQYVVFHSASVALCKSNPKNESPALLFSNEDTVIGDIPHPTFTFGQIGSKCVSHAVR